MRACRSAVAAGATLIVSGDSDLLGMATIGASRSSLRPWLSSQSGQQARPDTGARTAVQLAAKKI